MKSVEGFDSLFLESIFQFDLCNKNLSQINGRSRIKVYENQRIRCADAGHDMARCTFSSRNKFDFMCCQNGDFLHHIGLNDDATIVHHVPIYNLWPLFIFLHRSDFFGTHNSIIIRTNRCGTRE